MDSKQKSDVRCETPVCFLNAGSLADAVADAVLFFARLDAQTLKHKAYSVTARVLHPDGIEAKIVIKAFRLPCGDVMEIRRRGGDGLLFALVSKLYAAWVEGKQDNVRFYQGQLVPGAPCLKPATSPMPEENVPSLSLPLAHDDYADLIGKWGRTEYEKFALEHEDILASTRIGHVDGASWREHLSQVPAPMLKQYGIRFPVAVKCRLPCDIDSLVQKLEMLIAEAEAFWAGQLDPRSLEFVA